MTLSAEKMATDDPLIQTLEQVLIESKVEGVTSLTMMADTGLAHAHIWLARTMGDDWVARIPKQSQMGWSAQDNLAYQTACFERAGQSGNTPLLQTVIPAALDRLPRGCLLVSAVKGQAPKLPAALPAIANTLASIHALPVPSKANFAPLFAPDDPWQAMIEELQEQAAYLYKAPMSPLTRKTICNELAALMGWRDIAPIVESRLISFDAHPGNFLVQEDGRAILVDLEKCRYSLPGFDLAHASLYTSTTWDPLTHAELSLEDVRCFYRTWANAIQAQNIDYDEESILQCRRAMWLWSTTWCAKWLVENAQHRDTADGENWSSELSEANLVSHVAERVGHYLSESIVLKVCDEWHSLQREGLFHDSSA